MAGKLTRYDDHEKYPLMAIEYTDRISGEFKPNNTYTRIGDTIIGGQFNSGSGSSVEKIQLGDSYPISSLQSLRASGSVKNKESAGLKSFKLLASFYGDMAILGSTRPSKFVDGKKVNHINPNSLAALIAQFKKTPICPIEDLFVSTEHNTDCVALTSMQIYTTKEFPGLIKVELTFVEIDWNAYNLSQAEYIDSIIWPLWRWHWRNFYRDLAPGSIPIPTKNKKKKSKKDNEPWWKQSNEQEIVYGNVEHTMWNKPFNGILKFYKVNEGYLSDRLDAITWDETDNQDKEVPKEEMVIGSMPSAYEIPYEHAFSINDYDSDKNLNNTVASTISVYMNNIFSFQSPVSSNGSYVQFLGHGDTKVNMILTTYGDQGKINSFFEGMRYILSTYKAVVPYSPIICLNEIVNLCGVRAIVPSSRIVETEVGMPGIRQIALDFAEFDINQKEKNKAIRLFGVDTKYKKEPKNAKVDSVWSQSFGGPDGFRMNENSKRFFKQWQLYLQEIYNNNQFLVSKRGENIDDAIHKAQLSPWYGKIYTEIALEYLEQAEVYPDLDIPTYLRIISDIEDTINGTSNYFEIAKNSYKDKEILKKLKNQLGYLDELWYGQGRFVDPDFYVDYIRVVDKKKGEEMLNTDPDEFSGKARKATKEYFDTRKKEFNEIVEKEYKKQNEKLNNEDYMVNEILPRIKENLETMSEVYYQPIIKQDRRSKKRFNNLFEKFKKQWEDFGGSTKTISTPLSISSYTPPVDAPTSVIFIIPDKYKDKLILVNNLIIQNANTFPLNNDAIKDGRVIPAKDGFTNPSEVIEFHLKNVLNSNIQEYSIAYRDFGTVKDSMNDALIQEISLRYKEDRQQKLIMMGHTSGETREGDDDDKGNVKDHSGFTRSIKEHFVLGEMARQGFDKATQGDINNENSPRVPMIDTPFDYNNCMENYVKHKENLITNNLTTIDNSDTGEMFAYEMDLTKIDNDGSQAAYTMEWKANKKSVDLLMEDIKNKKTFGYYKLVSGRYEDEDLQENIITPGSIKNFMRSMNNDLKQIDSSKFTDVNKAKRLKKIWEEKSYKNPDGKSGLISLKTAWNKHRVGPANEPSMKLLCDQYASIRKLSKEESKNFGGKNAVLGATMSEALGKVDNSFTALDVKDAYASPYSNSVRGADTFLDQMLLPEGRLLYAFPTYSAQIIEEGPQVAWRKYLPIYWNMGSLSSINVTYSDVSATHICRLVLNDTYRNYTNTGMLEQIRDSMPQVFRTSKNWWYPTHLASEGLENVQEIWNSFLYTIGYSDSHAIISQFGLNGKQQHGKEIDVIRERMNSYKSMMLEPDHRIHVRLGYGSNARKLDVVFNGTVTSVSEGPVVEVMALGDGVELENKINKSYSNTDTVSNALQQPDPKETILSMMNAHHENYFINGIGDRIGRAWHQQAYIKSGGNWYADKGLGITHFGCPVMHRFDLASLHSSDYYLGIDRSFFPAVGGDKEAAKLGNFLRIQGALLIGTAPFGVGYLSLAGGTSLLFNHLFGTTLQGALGFGAPGETGENVYSGFSAINNYSLDYHKRLISEPDADSSNILKSHSNPPADFTRWTNPTLLGMLHTPNYRYGMNMKIKDKSAWDIIDAYARTFVPYIATVRPFEYRSTLFFGAPYYTYRFDYNRIHSSVYDGKDQSVDILGEDQISEEDIPWISYNETEGTADAIRLAYDQAMKVFIRMEKKLGFFGKKKYGYTEDFDKDNPDMTSVTLDADLYYERIIRFRNILKKRLEKVAGNVVSDKQIKNLVIHSLDSNYEPLPRQSSGPSLYKIRFNNGQLFVKSVLSGDAPSTIGYLDQITLSPKKFVNYYETHDGIKKLKEIHKSIKAIGLPVQYLCKPLNQMFIHFSGDNILANDIKCTSENLYTNVIARYFANNKDNVAKKHEQAWLDKGIFPQLRRTQIVDTDIVGSSGHIKAATATILSFFSATGGKLDNFFREIVGKPGLTPDNMGDYTVKHHVLNTARAYLRDSMKNTYTGSIVVKGNPKIFPYCQSYLLDESKAISGAVDIGRTSHMFDLNHGFVTVYEPKMKAYVKGDMYNVWMHSIIGYIAKGALTTLIMTTKSLIANTLLKFAINSVVTRTIDVLLKDVIAKKTLEGFKLNINKATNVQEQLKHLKVMLNDIVKNNQAKGASDAFAKIISKHIAKEGGGEVVEESIKKVIKKNLKKNIGTKLYAKTITANADDIAKAIVQASKGTNLDEKVIQKMIQNQILKETGEGAVEQVGKSAVATAAKSYKALAVNIIVFIAIEVIMDWVTYWWDRHIDSFYSLQIMPLKKRGKNYISGISGAREGIIIFPDGSSGTKIDYIMKNKNVKDTSGISVGGAGDLVNTQK